MNLPTIIDKLEYWNFHQGNKKAFTYLEDGEERENSITYSELLNASRNLAGVVQEYAKQGDRVILLYPSGIDFIIAFFACLTSGVIAIPAVLPRNNRSTERLDSIMKNAGSNVILTSTKIPNKKLVSALGCERNYHIVETDVVNNVGCRSILIGKDDIAFLQYTSGSTGAPKGVVINHGNIIENVGLIAKAFHQNEDSVVFGWLPFYHDMGLIGNILHPINKGISTILISPAHFLSKPLRWLKGISKYNATTSGGPNFAYSLCTEKVTTEEAAELDLSCWKVAFNGSEPVRLNTLNRFVEKFKTAGFSTSSIYTCYGMAETTLLVSSAKMENEIRFESLPAKEQSWTDDTSSKKMVDFVSCGSAGGFKVEVVDSERNTLEEGKVGEIWLSGKSISRGYWNDKTLSENAFQNILNNEVYFRTGDLGFIKGGELFIAGRLREMIIINGRNYYPSDIENTITDCDWSLIGDGCAAFSVEVKEKESLIIVSEVEFNETVDYRNIVNKIFTTIHEEYELEVREIILIRKGSIPKTTSGKIQRGVCKQQYLAGNLKVVYKSSEGSIDQPGDEELSETDQKIKEIFYSKFRIAIPSVKTNFFSLGLDSIKITQLVSVLVEDLGFQVDINDIYQNPTIEALGAVLVADRQEVKAITPSIIKHYYNITSIQRGIWFDQQRRPFSNAYNIPLLINLGDTLNQRALENAVNHLIERHEVLRTSFHAKEGIPVQVVEPRFDYKLAKPKDFNQAGKTEVDAFLKEESGKPFDLNQLPLFRTQLIKANNAYKLLLVIHHIIADGISVMALISELKEGYKNIPSGRDPEVRALESLIQYKDYSEWEFENNKNNEDKAFWSSYLGKSPRQFDFINEKLFINKNHQKGASLIKNIDLSLANQLAEVAKKEQVSLYTLLLSAYLMLLHRLTGKQSITVGSPIQTRKAKELWKMQGIFLNTLMLKAEVDQNENVRSFVGKVKRNLSDCLQHSNYPFNQILEDIKFVPSKEQFPVSSIFFNGHNFIDEQVDEDYLETFLCNLDLDMNFDLNCYTANTRKGLHIRFDYKTSLFSKKTIENIAFNYEYVLKQIIEGQTANIGDLKVVKLSSENNAKPQKPFESFSEQEIEGTIAKRFEEVVKRYPEKVALKQGNTELAYCSLHQRTNALAHFIQDNFDRAGDKQHTIGLLLGQEIDAVIAILGILKSENIYVPLDISYPEARLQEIIEDAKIEMILTNTEHWNTSERISSGLPKKIRLVNINRIEHQADGNLRRTNDAQKLAYILYTSGSTGKPKGVVQSEKYILFITYSFTNSLCISAEDKITLLPSFNFSASMMDMFGALLNGSTLVIYDVKKEGITNLGSLIKKEGITIYHSVPTLFRHFAETIVNPDDLEKLRLIYLAGEPLLRTDIELYKRYFPEKCLLINGLGCTELNICRQFFIDKKTYVNSYNIPVGYKALGVDVVLINEEGIEVTGNETGEIAVKARYMSEGYWGNETLTGQKFETLESGERIFYTGDLGQYTYDGCLFHLGRKDFQIKIRGQRVEPSEIEIALLELDGIHQVAVAAFSKNDQNNLVAYMVSRTRYDNEFIRSFLKGKIPEYMIPNFYVSMESLPTTNTGKINRNALILPQIENETKGVVLVKNAIEKKVVDYLSMIMDLQKEQISTQINLFDLGINSMHILQLNNKLVTSLNVDIPVSSMFRYSTITELAEYINTLIKPQQEREQTVNETVSYSTEKSVLMRTLSRVKE